MARMARFSPSFPGRGGGGTLARLLVGRVRRRRPVGSRRVLREASFQGFDTGLELPQLIVHGVQIGLHSRGGVLPVLWGEGKRPAGVRELR